MSSSSTGDQQQDANAAAAAAAVQLTIARQSYAAAVVGIMTFGMYVVLAAVCLHFLFKLPKKTTGHYVTTAYAIIMLLVSIVYFTCASKWSEVEFVESAIDPGAFATLTSGSTLTITKNVATTVNIFLADSLIVYRTYIVWAKNINIIVIPCLMYLGTIATGIGTLYWSSRPNAQFGQQNFVSFGTSFYSISIALNVLTTALIAGKLIYHQRQMSKIRQSSEYLSLVAILVESAAVYSLTGIVYIPLFALNLPQQYAFASLLGSATVIAPTLIIMRIALGVAVKEDHHSKLTSAYHMNTGRGAASGASGTTGSRTQHVSAWSGNKSEATLPTHVVEFHPMSSMTAKDERY